MKIIKLISSTLSVVFSDINFIFICYINTVDNRRFYNLSVYDKDLKLLADSQINYSPYHINDNEIYSFFYDDESDNFYHRNGSFLLRLK